MTRALILVTVVAAAGGCSKSSREAPPPGAATDDAARGASRPSPPADALLVGVVQQSGTPICDAAGNRRWLDRRDDIGFVPVVADGAVAERLAALRGEPVVARGRALERAPDPEPVPDDAVDCPAEQMRGDWVRGPAGMRMRRRGGAGLAAFAADAVEPFDGLRASRADSGALVLEWENRLGRPLPGPVELVVHYEGCYGKPGTERRSHAVEGGLADGATARAELPALVQAPRVPGNPKGTSDHRAYSVQLRAGGDGVHFDFDLRLPALGVEVRCPE